MEKFNYKEYLAEGWLFKEVVDNLNNSTAIFDQVCKKEGFKKLENVEVPEDPNMYVQGRVSDGAVEGTLTIVLQDGGGYHRGWYFHVPDEDGRLVLKRQGSLENNLEEAGAKDAYFNRQKRVAKGNWKGSVGKYVEDHRAEIDAAAQRGHGELRAYMRSTMMPALGPEAQEYLEGLLTGYATDQQLHMALYNILLKGQGLGLHEEEQGSTEGWEEDFREYAQEGGWDDETINQVIQIGNQHPEWIPDICGYGENPVADYEVFLEDPEAYMQSSVKDRAMDLSRRKYAFDNNNI